MNLPLHQDEKFENLDYTEQAFSDREFDHCEFINCDFSKTNLGNNDFMECIFSNCNLSMALLKNTGLKNCAFLQCKLMGIDFSACNDFLFTVSFKGCQMDYSSFFQKKMKKTIFADCSLKEVDFVEADLSQAVFNNTDLTNAAFVRTILEKADFRTAVNYSFDPELNKIKKAKFSYLGIGGILSKYEIDIEYK